MKVNSNAVLFLVGLIIAGGIFGVKHYKLEKVTEDTFQHETTAALNMISNVQSRSDHWIKTGKLSYSSGMERDLMELQDYFSSGLYKYYVSGEPNRAHLFFSALQGEAAGIYLEAGGAAEIDLSEDQIRTMKDYNLVLHAISAVWQPVNYQRVDLHSSARHLDTVDGLFNPKYQNKLQWCTMVLYSAITEGNLEVVEVLLDRGLGLYDNEALNEAAAFARSRKQNELGNLIASYIKE